MRKQFRSDDFVFGPTSLSAALGPLIGKPLVFAREPRVLVNGRVRSVTA